MPCSRTPQWKVRPVVVGPKVPPCFSVVPVLPPRSADPPTRLGTAAAIACSARPEACRVASCPPAEGTTGRALSQPSGGHRKATAGAHRPAGARRRTPRIFLPPALELGAPTIRAMRQRIIRYVEFGSWGHPMISLVRRTSSAPSGAPCASALFRLVGAGSAMAVRRTMRRDGRLGTGRLVCRADGVEVVSVATFTTCQP